MKETDYTLIQAKILDRLSQQEWTIEDYLPETAIVLAISNIYTTNDMCSGFGQDFESKFLAPSAVSTQTISIISSRQRISIITKEGMSFYKADLSICGYEDLDEDISNIFVIIQAVLDRIITQ